MAKNKKLRQQITQEIVGRRMPSGLTGRAGGPRPAKMLKSIGIASVAKAGVRYMNATDPDDNVMDHYPSKRELAMFRKARPKKMRRR